MPGLSLSNLKQAILSSSSLKATYLWLAIPNKQKTWWVGLLFLRWQHSSTVFPDGEFLLNIHSFWSSSLTELGQRTTRPSTCGDRIRPHGAFQWVRSARHTEADRHHTDPRGRCSLSSRLETLNMKRRYITGDEEQHEDLLMVTMFLCSSQMFFLCLLLVGLARRHRLHPFVVGGAFTSARPPLCPCGRLVAVNAKVCCGASVRMKAALLHVAVTFDAKCW